MNETAREAQRWLDGCRSMNGGLGLIVTQAMAEHLKSLGINGPYTVQKQLGER